MDGLRPSMIGDRVEASKLLRAGEAAGHVLVAAARARVDALVGSCPEWTVADLVAHTGTFTSQFLGRMDGAATNGPWSGDVPAPSQRVDWYERVHCELVSVFEAIEANGWVQGPPAPQLSTGHVRRWAHEMSVHAWDAQGAVGSPDAIEAELAADGVEETFDWGMRTAPWWTLKRSDKTIAFVATDGPYAWRLRFDGDELQWTAGESDADVTVRADVSGLHLFLWGRRRQDAAITGDVSALALLRGA